MPVAASACRHTELQLPTRLLGHALLLLRQWRLGIRGGGGGGRLQGGRGAARPWRLIRQGRRGHALPRLRCSTSAWKRCHALRPGLCTLF
jgi:hypothetical protein